VKRALPMLPPMRCDDGCGDCCGIVPVTNAEFDRVARYAEKHGIKPVEHADIAQCPMYQDGKCAVYPVRPLICQAFGHTPDLGCSRGYNTNVRQRDVDLALAGNGKPAKLLHELIPGFTERAATWNAAQLVLASK
jgi:Fe-S-cluster containining protein